VKVSKSSIAGWVLSSLLAALLIVGSASGKFTEWEGKADMFAKLGWSAEVMFRIGLVEVACAILFLIPRTSFVAAILLTGYLGGATATHIRVGDPFHMPVIIGVVVWTSLGLRDPRIFSAAFQKQPSRRTTSSEE
tara:strand:+ start:70579 stop:70983 length:405 start_codon:yes stop_codon:yes gene_type:complete